MQHVHDCEAGIKADKVSKLKWTHRVIGAELHGVVDRGDIADAFIERIAGLVDHRDQDAIDDKGGEVFGGGGCLTELFDHGEAALICLVISGDAADQLDQLHERNRVHKVKAHELFGAVRACGEAGDRDRGGV